MMYFDHSPKNILEAVAISHYDIIRYKTVDDLREYLNYNEDNKNYILKIAHAVVREKRTEMMEMLINEFGFDVKSGNNFCLKMCIESFFPSFEMFKLLIENGADIHCSDNTYDNKSDYIMYTACKCGHTNIVKYLIDLGVNVNGNNGDYLVAGIIHKHADIIKLLLMNGFDTNLLNSYPINNGKSLFGKKSNNNLMEVINLLLEKNADPLILIYLMSFEFEPKIEEVD